MNASLLIAIQIYRRWRRLVNWCSLVGRRLRLATLLDASLLVFSWWCPFLLPNVNVGNRGALRVRAASTRWRNTSLCAYCTAARAGSSSSQRCCSRSPACPAAPAGVGHWWACTSLWACRAAVCSRSSRWCSRSWSACSVWLPDTRCSCWFRCRWTRCNSFAASSSRAPARGASLTWCSSLSPSSSPSWTARASCSKSVFVVASAASLLNQRPPKSASPSLTLPLGVLSSLIGIIL